MASARKFFKRLGRKTAKVHKQINRIATPLVAAGASYFGGPVAGAAVTAAGAQASYYFRATEARDKGIRGRSARELGRGERKRVAIYGAIGTGTGALASGASSLIAGKTFGQSLLATGFGQGGAELFSPGSSIIGTPTAQQIASGVGPFGSLKPVVAGTQLPSSTGVPGLVTQSQLSASLAGGSTATEAAAAAGSSSSTLAKVLGVAPALLNAYSTAKPASTGANGNINPNSYGLGPDLGSMFGGGGGGGGDSGMGGGFMNAPAGMGQESKNGGMIAAILIGALLLAG